MIRNGTATATATQIDGNVKIFPSLIEMDVQGPKPLSWIKTRLYELGVIDMETQPTRPPGFFFNYSTALFYLAIIAAVCGGFWWTWQQASLAGYERGKQDIRLQMMEQRLTEAESTAKKAALLEASKAGDVGHKKEK